MLNIDFWHAEISYVWRATHMHSFIHEFCLSDRKKMEGQRRKRGQLIDSQRISPLQDFIDLCDNFTDEQIRTRDPIIPASPVHSACKLGVLDTCAAEKQSFNYQQGRGNCSDTDNMLPCYYLYINAFQYREIIWKNWTCFVEIEKITNVCGD